VTEARKSRISAGTIINLGIILVGIVVIVVLLVAQLIKDDPGASEPIDLTLRFEPVAEGLAGPVLLIGAGDGSADRYVVEQHGRVLRLASDGAADATPLLDIRDRVLHHHERGLMGLAFHPDFADNGRFFVTYSRADDGATSISEFTLPADAEAGPVEASERALLTIPQPFTTHKGGMLAFDHDGKLLVGVGDGGSSDDPHDNGQDRASLLGKLLRLDVDRGWPYATPLDNGFADDREAKPEIHAIGLRNPWRFSVDRDSGDVYIGDVGQREWEEVNVLPKGARGVSFGWSDMEGLECFGSDVCDPADHVLPAIAYPHLEATDGRCAIIGGYAYRGEAGTLPDGTYLYADYCSRTIWGVPVGQLLSDTAAPAEVGQLPTDLGRVASFGEDDAGELYVLTSEGHVLGIGQADPA
jgi:glucose/arabinose dehydrogenase